MLALGIKESVLTAKHGCGFCTWPTKATLPDGKPYGYNVEKELDVLGPYVKSMRQAGIGHGFYYSLDSNYYLQRGLNVSADQFQAIEIAQLTGEHRPLVPPFLAGLGLHSDGHGRLPATLFAGLCSSQRSRACVAELWTQYGNLTEIWLDGGFSPAIQSALQSTFKTYQPRVVAMNGGGASPNAVRWVGTEGDMGAAWGEGIWSTYCCNGTGPASWPTPTPARSTPARTAAAAALRRARPPTPCATAGSRRAWTTRCSRATPGSGSRARSSARSRSSSPSVRPRILRC